MRVSLLPRELHTGDRPSATAQWTTLGRALELDRPAGGRIVSDTFAPTFLSTPGRRLIGRMRHARRLVQFAERTELASIATSALCRHRFIDVHLLESLPDVDQVLILGAGYDSRAYRFRRPIASRPVFEVDLAPLSRLKAATVAAHPEVFGPSTVRSVDIDFRTQSLADRLRESGFDAGRATFVAWEGVAMYLTRDAVVSTLDALAQVCGPGSTIALDCWRHVGGRSAYDQLRRVGERAIRLLGEPITFVESASGMSALLADAGFATVDLATAGEMTRRFATGGRRCDDGMFVLAARLA